MPWNKFNHGRERHLQRQLQNALKEIVEETNNSNNQKGEGEPFTFKDTKKIK